MELTRGQQIAMAAAPAGQAPAARRALAGLALTMLLPSLDTSIANASLPALTRALDATFAQAQWVVLAYLLAITTLIVSVGRLGDVMGRRRLLLAGIAVFTAASLLCGAAPNVATLIAARAAQGAGAAVMLALTVAMAGQAAAPGRTGSAMGLLGTMSAAGTALGPSLGGVLTATVGWRAIFLVNVPLGLLAMGLAWRYLPGDEGRTVEEAGARPRFDMAGTVLLAATLGSYALAMTLGHGAVRFGVPNAALLVAAVVGAALFVRVEARTAAPLVRPSMLRERGLGTGLALSALVATVMMATLVVGPFHLTRALGLDAARAGLALSVGPLMAALAGVPAGRLTDRFGVRAMTMVGLGGMAVGCSGVAVMPLRAGVLGYVLPLAMLTSSYALFQAANNTAIMSGADAARRGVVAGMLNLARNLGLITGVAVMGAVFAGFLGSADVEAAEALAVARATRGVFGVGTGAVFAGVLIAVGARRR